MSVISEKHDSKLNYDTLVSGNVQETLEHLLYECRCPEVVRLRHEYAKTFSAPSVGEWLTSYHSARYVFAALDVLAQWKVRAAKQLADAAASGAPPPPLATGASSIQSINILRRPVQKSMDHFLRKPGDSRGGDT